MFRRNRFHTALVVLLLLSVTACSSRNSGGGAAELDLSKRVRKVVLDNGLRVIFVNRGTAPIFTAYLFVKVGGIDEGTKPAGMAHFFEHMAFKGTDKLGTSDFAAEKKLLDRILNVGTRAVKMRIKGRPPAEIEPLVKERMRLEEEARKYIVNNEFFNFMVRNGAATLNAGTSFDYTAYFTAMPSSKLELWAYLESERMTKRVYREFFTEVDVVAEERRMSIDNSPDGRLYVALLKTAFQSSPYQSPSIGGIEDIRDFTPKRAEEFYRKFYIPTRMVIAMAGNFDVDTAENTIRKYFSRLPAGKDIPQVFAEENLAEGKPRETVIHAPTSPRFYLGYHRPAAPHPDDAALEVLANLLCEGNTSRFIKTLVIKRSIAQNVDCYSSFPGDRLPALFTFDVLPIEGHANRAVKEALLGELHILGDTGPTADELRIVRNRIMADRVFDLEGNTGLAANLGYYEILWGDWRYYLTLDEEMLKVTADDIKRVIATYFVPEREVAAYLENGEME